MGEYLNVVSQILEVGEGDSGPEPPCAMYHVLFRFV